MDELGREKDQMAYNKINWVWATEAMSITIPTNEGRNIALRNEIDGAHVWNGRMIISWTSKENPL